MRRDNGEGTIWFNEKKNFWVGKYSIYDNENKPIRKSIYGKTKKEVQKQLAEIMYQKNNKKYIMKHGIPLVEIIKNNRDKKLNANLISYSQYNRIGQIGKIIESNRIGKMDIDKITADDIQQFLNDNTHYSNSTINKIYEQLNQAFKIAIQNKYIIDNPITYILKPKSNKDTKLVKALTVDKQKTLTKYLLNSTMDKEKYKNAFLIQLYMGLRIGEALALSSDDIDLENKFMHVNKTLTLDKEGKVALGNKTKTYAGKRNLPIPNFMENILEEQINYSNLKKSNLLFSYNNNPVHPTTVNSQFKRMLKNLDIYEEGLSTHSLRHSYGTRCIESSMPAVVLQRLMGHTDIKITLNTYTEIFNDFKQSEIDKVNNYYEKNHFLDDLEK